MTTRFKEKVVVMTGGGRGIGRSMALAFAEEGADVAVAARTRQQIETVAREIEAFGRRAIPYVCDISIAGEVKGFAQEVEQVFGRVDILVNNAGISNRSRFLDYDDEAWLEVIRVNLFGVYLCTKAFLPLLQKVGRGRILMMASTAGKAPAPFNTAYSASKHGLLGLTKSLASELALCGYPEITVNAICPFFVETAMFSGPEGYVAQMERSMGLSKEEVMGKVREWNLQRRVLEPSEVVSLAVYLASDDAKGITGQAINVCGGRIFH